MSTAKEILMELLKKDGQPERLLKQYEPFEQIMANPKIEICAFDGSRWLRLTARALEDDRYEARKHMLDAYPSLQKMYQPDDGNTQVFALEDCTAVFSSFTEEPRTVRF